MSRTKSNLLSFMILAIILVLSSIVPVFANDINSNTIDRNSITIDMNQVQKEWDKAEEVPVVRDKASLNLGTINLTETVETKGVEINATGTYPKRKGVILVTSDKMKGIIPTGHAAIVYTSTRVVESLSNGVTTGNNDWNKTRTAAYGVTVNGTTAAQDSNAANWCYRQIGKKYNFNYLNVNTRSSFYCSHLVWASFLDLYGINLNTSLFGAAVHPMELVNTSKTSKIYQK